MTATPSAAEQAEQWAKEHVRNPLVEWIGVDAYLAGHAAGEVAGAERERARVCVWTRVRDNEYSDHRRGCNGQMLSIGFVTDGDYCSRCGGRIEVRE